MPPDPNVHVGVAAVVQRGSDLLLLQRGSRASYADGYGKWALPGGWLEHGERAHDAARREVEEETGLVARPLRDDGFDVGTSADGRRHVVTLFVVCEYLGGEPVNAEPEKALAVRWTPMEHLVELDLFTPLDRWWRRPRNVALSEFRCPVRGAESGGRVADLPPAPEPSPLSDEATCRR